MKRAHILRGFLSPLATLLVILLVWEAANWLSGAPRYLLPTPWEAGEAAWRERARLVSAGWITGREAAAAFAISAAAGAVVATVAARWRAVGRWVLPAAIPIQTVPIIALAPIVQNWVGSGAGAVTTIAALIGFFPILVNATRGLLSVPAELLDLFATHGATSAQTLWKLRWPCALPSFFAGLRVAAGLTVVGAITGELFVGSARMGVGGLGYSLSYANSQLQTDYLFALAVLSSALGLAFYAVVVGLERVCLGPWHPPPDTKEERRR